MILDEFKSETVSYLDMKLSYITSNKPSSTHYQHSDDLIKLSLLKSSENSSHASQFINHLYFMTLEGDTLL